ncbi:uncharacterized protein LOC109504007 [Harpegnathos saltator]|uniref:uncharacterized protein LOC109504007 n=1 Tax=Harpegnathos saltator TaxID=610380 RepID=UPI000948998F|nr:uncharacterized protein LOC109504007 [Harpegnathos saltator]
MSRVNIRVIIPTGQVWKSGSRIAEPTRKMQNFDSEISYISSVRIVRRPLRSKVDFSTSRRRERCGMILLQTPIPRFGKTCDLTAADAVPGDAVPADAGVPEDPVRAEQGRLEELSSETWPTLTSKRFGAAFLQKLLPNSIRLKNKISLRISGTDGDFYSVRKFVTLKFAITESMSSSIL